MGSPSVKTFKTTRTHCPVCQETFDAATSVIHHRAPEPGMPSVCMYCLSFLVFDEALRVQKLSEFGFLCLPPQIRQVLLQTRWAMMELTDGVIGRRRKPV